jgi:hypothetical protein
MQITDVKSTYIHTYAVSLTHAEGMARANSGHAQQRCIPALCLYVPICLCPLPSVARSMLIWSSTYGKTTQNYRYPLVCSVTAAFKAAQDTAVM